MLEVLSWRRYRFEPTLCIFSGRFWAVGEVFGVRCERATCRLRGGAREGSFSFDEMSSTDCGGGGGGGDAAPATKKTKIATEDLPPPKHAIQKSKLYTGKGDSGLL